jgi:hypothetical protein
MTTLTRFRPVAAILRKLGVDPVHYGLLLDLFGKLSDRQEFEAGNARISLRVAVGTFAFFIGVINLVIAFGPRPPVKLYVFGNLIVTTFMVVMILTMEAVNTFLNPLEASLLAHQPIRDRTYFASKLTFLGVVIGYVVFPINIVPALAGLNLPDASWLHPLTYLIAAYLYGLFLALIVCGVLGSMFRILPVSRVRNSVLWVQIGFIVLLGAGPQIAAMLRGVTRNINLGNSTILPMNWFVALAMPMNSGWQELLTWPAIAALAGCILFILFGIQALSKDYMMRVHGLLRSGPSGRRLSSGTLGGAIRAIVGKPSGRAAFAFIYAMARTDWQFRRTAYPMLLQFMILPLLGLARTGLGHSPFQPGPPTFSQLLPHCAGALGLIFSFAILYSNQHRAAWIFITFPEASIRSFARGIFWTLWSALSVLPVVLFPLCAWRWGIGDALLFMVYSLAIGSFYLSLELFLIDGMPFANPPEQLKGSMSGPLILVALLGASVLVLLQWLFVFQSRFVTAGAILVFIGGAYLLARVSIRYLEVNVLHNLHIIAMGRKGMFKEVN